MKFLLAHNKDHFVAVGDKVKKYQTKVASVGKGYNNEYSAHLHISAYKNLTDAQVKGYVDGWTKKKVQEYYTEPAKLVDFTKMFGQKMNLTNGWGWLQNYGKGYHPANDVNHPAGGDSDYGMEYTAPCDGVVVYAGDWGSGWGKCMIIEEAPLKNDCVPSGDMSDDDKEFANRKGYKTFEDAVQGAREYRNEREECKLALSAVNEEYKDLQKTFEVFSDNAEKISWEMQREIDNLKKLREDEIALYTANEVKLLEKIDKLEIKIRDLRIKHSFDIDDYKRQLKSLETLDKAGENLKLRTENDKLKLENAKMYNQMVRPEKAESFKKMGDVWERLKIFISSL